MTKNAPHIITVGLCPCWDITCYVDQLRRHGHQRIERQTVRPAGKALNVSRVLAQMGIPTAAAGLWGRQDYPALRRAMDDCQGRLRCRFTVVPGLTRHNVTIINTRRGWDMHLRAPGELTSSRALQRLKNDLAKIVSKNDICVFAGSLPGQDYRDGILELLQLCRRRRARLVIDSSGPLLDTLVETSRPWLIKPNVEEFRQLVKKNVPDRPADLVEAGRRLLRRVKILLISRGRNGALLMTPAGAWQAKITAPRKKVLSTVACGDYLLAGFLKGYLAGQKNPLPLEPAVQAATLRAWHLTDQPDWAERLEQIKVCIRKIR